MTDELMALLPCPFCGSDEGSHGWASPGFRSPYSDGHVECMNCGALIVADTEDEAIAAWNRRAELPALIAEVERLREALAKATKPSFYWDSEDSENGCDDLAVIMDNHDLGEVVRIQCAATLPDQWAVGFVNETGGFEAKAFATEAEAVAFAAARAALGASHDGK